jgi:hypothetical protein
VASRSGVLMQVRQVGAKANFFGPLQLPGVRYKLCCGHPNRDRQAGVYWTRGRLRRSGEDVDVTLHWISSSAAVPIMIDTGK